MITAEEVYQKLLSQKIESLNPTLSRGDDQVPMVTPSSPGATAVGTPVSDPGEALSVSGNAGVSMTAPPTSVETPLPQVAQAPIETATIDPDSVYQKLLAQREESSERQLSPVQNLINGFNGDLGKKIENVGQVFGTSQVVNPVTGAISTGHDLAQGILQKYGYDYLKSDRGTLLPARKIMNELGIGTEYNKGSTMGHIGEKVLDSMITLSAMFAAAPLMAPIGAASNGTGFWRSVGESIQKHPWLTIVSEAASDVGAATIGQDGGPGWELLGAVAGGVAGGGLAALSAKGIKISQKAYNSVLDAVQNFSEATTGTKSAALGMSQGQKVPAVSEHILEGARDAESKARMAGEATVEAAAQVRKTIPFTHEQLDAKVRLADAKQAEKAAIAEAEKEAAKLPKVDGVPMAGRNLEAIRSEFADTVFPKAFAQDQIEGEQKVIQDRITAAMSSVTSKHTPEEAQAIVKSGVQDAEKMASAIEGRYWSRTPQNTRIGRSGLSDDLAAFNEEMQTLDRMFVPGERIGALQNILAPQSSPGVFQPRPTVGKLLEFHSTLGQKMREERAALAPNDRLIRNYARLDSLVTNHIGREIPEDVTIQQARAASKMYHDIFSTSDLDQLLRTTKKGGEKVAKETAVEHLMSKAQGMPDLWAMTEKLQARRLPGQADAHPRMLGPEDKGKLVQLQQDTEDSIRAMVQADIAKFEQDPVKVAGAVEKMVPRIKGFAKSQAELTNLGDTLRTLVDSRKAIEGSMLNKYMQADADKALNVVFSNSNPSAVAKALINGEAGIGGFKTNPIAMAGFRNGIIDRVFTMSEGSPLKMQETMREGPMSRLLKTTLSPEQHSRMTRIVDAAASISRGDIQTFGQKYARGISYVAQLLALKTSGGLSKLGLLTSGGGEMRQASMFSEMAKSSVMKAFTGGDPKAMMMEAIINPHWEKMLLARAPLTTKESAQNMQSLRRLIRMEVGMREVMNTYLRDDKQKPTSVNKALPSHVPFANYEATQEYYNRGISIDRDPYKDYSKNQTGKLDFIPSITPRGFAGNAFSKAMANEPMSENIDDRRVKDKTIGGYSKLVRGMDAEGLSHAPKGIPGAPDFRGFIRRAGPVDGPVPMPRPNPFRGATETTEEYRMMEPRNRGKIPEGSSGGSGSSVSKGHVSPEHLDNVVTEWARGNMTAKEVQKAFKKEGWTVDLRRGRYDVEAFDPSGKSHYITP